MFIDELIGRGLLPAMWEDMAPGALMRCAESINSLPAREWVIELAQSRQAAIDEAGLIIDIDRVEQQLGEARFESEDTQIAVAVDECLPVMLAEEAEDGSWWHEAIHTACYNNPEVRSLQVQLRAAQRAAVDDDVDSWGEWAESLRGAHGVGRLYEQIWQAERALVGSGSPMTTTADQWAQIRRHTPSSVIERIDSKRRQFEQELRDKRAAQVTQLQQRIEQNEQTRASMTWPPLPDDPAADENSHYMWDAPWTDGVLTAVDGGSWWQARWSVRADKDAVWEVVSAHSDSLDDYHAAFQVLKRGMKLSHRPPVDKSDIDAMIGARLLGNGASRLLNRRRLYHALLKIEWHAELLCEWDDFDGVTYHAKVAPRAHEEEVIARMKRLGAHWVERPLQVPKYKSWATIKPCKTMQYVERHDDGSIRLFCEYTPHAHDQTAPFSERGVFVAYAQEDLVARHLVESFGGSWIATDGEWLVPAFARKASVKQHRLPGLILHGMTGVDNDAAASQRLKLIVDTGGLASIATRRQRRMSFVSLSPLGDIGSGLDWGVPCKIGIQPSYGNHVYFVMRPSIVNRRNIWFSDRDFGGGSSRYEQYNAYAQQIGHERFWMPPSDDARDRHYREGSGGDNNEVWFADRIDLSEIEAIYVANSSAFSWLQGELDDYAQRTGQPHIEVCRFSSPDDLSAKLATRYNNYIEEYVKVHQDVPEQASQLVEKQPVMVSSATKQYTKQQQIKLQKMMEWKAKSQKSQNYWSSW